MQHGKFAIANYICAYEHKLFINFEDLRKPTAHSIKLGCVIHSNSMAKDFFYT